MWRSYDVVMWDVGQQAATRRRKLFCTGFPTTTCKLEVSPHSPAAPRTWCWWHCYHRDVLVLPRCWVLSIACSVLGPSPHMAQVQPWSHGLCQLLEKLHQSQPDLSLLNTGGRGVTQIREKIGRMQESFLKGFSINRNFILLRQFPDSFNLTPKPSTFILMGRETFENLCGSLLLAVSVGRWRLAIGANEQL